MDKDKEDFSYLNANALLQVVDANFSTLEVNSISELQECNRSLSKIRKKINQILKTKNNEKELKQIKQNSKTLKKFV